MAPGLPTDAPDKFGGAPDPTGRPAVVYPLPDSVHPVNIGDVTVQWSQGKPENTLFRIRLENARGRYDFFVPCTVAECIQTMPEAEWLQVASANPDGDVVLTVSGTADGAGPPASTSTSDPSSFRFSPEAVRGGLYYWSTALKGMYRLTFGAKKAVPYISPGTPANDRQCGGCHAVSRDGQVITFVAAEDAIAMNRSLVVAPTSDPVAQTVKPGMHKASISTLNRDGSRVLVAFADELVLRDTKTGAMIAQVPRAFFPANQSPYMPDWSYDGTQIAVTMATKSYDDQYIFPPYEGNLSNGEIGVMPYNDGAFGPVNVIVPEAGEIHFYPSWSPDGRWIVFATAPKGSRTYDNANARLRLVASTGGVVYELKLATQMLGRNSTWPKFSPFVQAGGQVLFIAFSSKIDYGFVLKNLGFYGFPQLWLAAIDVRRLSSGDPSSAPIWLPFQEVNQNNHLPYWTEVIACKPGGTAGAMCGDGEVCKDGACVKS